MFTVSWNFCTTDYSIASLVSRGSGQRGCGGRGRNGCGRITNCPEFFLLLHILMLAKVCRNYLTKIWSYCFSYTYITNLMRASLLSWSVIRAEHQAKQVEWSRLTNDALLRSQPGIDWRIWETLEAELPSILPGKACNDHIHIWEER